MVVALLALLKAGFPFSFSAFYFYRFYSIASFMGGIFAGVALSCVGLGLFIFYVAMEPFEPSMQRISQQAKNSNNRLGFLSRRRSNQQATGYPSSEAKPTPVIFLHSSYEGTLWTMPPSLWPRDKILPSFPPEHAGPSAIAHKWKGLLRQGVLTLTSAEDGRRGKVEIPLNLLEVNIVTETNPGNGEGGKNKSPWAKRRPLELIIPRAHLGTCQAIRPYNEPSLFIFADTAASKEQWFNALSSSSSSSSYSPSLLAARSMFSEFCQSMSRAMGPLVSPPPPPLKSSPPSSDKLKTLNAPSSSNPSASKAQQAPGGRRFGWLARLIPGRRGKNQNSQPMKEALSAVKDKERVLLRIVVDESGCSLKSSLVVLDAESSPVAQERKLLSSTSLLADLDSSPLDLPPLNPNAETIKEAEVEDEVEVEDDFTSAANEDGFTLPGLFGLNRFIMRLGYELLVSKKLDQWLSRWISRRLDDFNNGPRPEFLGPLELVSMDLGNVLPLIKDIKSVSGSLNNASEGSAFPQIAAQVIFKGEATLSFSTSIDPQKASFVKSLAETLKGIATGISNPGNNSQEGSSSQSGRSYRSPSPDSSLRASADEVVPTESSSDRRSSRSSGGGVGLIGGLIGKLASLTESIPVIPVRVEVKITQFEGELLAWIAPPPSDRIWISFSSPPTVSLSTRPVLSGRVFKYSALLHQVSSIIKNRIIKAINRQLVFPSCADVRIPFFASHVQAAAADANNQSQPPPSPSKDDISLPSSASLHHSVSSVLPPSNDSGGKLERKSWFARRPPPVPTNLAPPPGLKAPTPKPPKVPSSHSIASLSDSNDLSSDRKVIGKKGFTFRLRFWGGGKKGSEKSSTRDPSPEPSQRLSSDPAVDETLDEALSTAIQEEGEVQGQGSTAKEYLFDSQVFPLQLD